MNRISKIPYNCLFKVSDFPEIENDKKKCRRLCHRYNQICPTEREKLKKILDEILSVDTQSVRIAPPFRCDFGYNIVIGKNFYANHNLIINDGATVTAGDNVYIGPNCCITTAEHAIDYEQRNLGYEIAKPVIIGSNVWIGAGSIILAGSRIGDNTVIGAGSVVTGIIPNDVIAVGVPCRVKREITVDDKNKYAVYDFDGN